MKSPQKIATPVQAAGGIVVRDASEPLIAVVRLRKNKAWVLPKGKLKADEDALAAARREVLEETGHEVTVHAFLGAMSQSDGAKIVHFWHMRAEGGPARKLMRDVKAVKWLPLDEALETLTHPHERAFLREVGPVALQARPGRGTPAQPVPPRADTGSFAERIRAWFGRMMQGR